MFKEDLKSMTDTFVSALYHAVEGTFGVPLEVLVERNGVDSALGAGPGRIRIPSFVDDSISAMRNMGR
jgi:hypothetical protein